MTNWEEYLIIAVNEDGRVYRTFETLDEGLLMLEKFPNDSINIRFL